MSWLALSLLLSGAAPAAEPAEIYAPYSAPGRLVDIGEGRRLNIRCQGEGRPTIILESGLSFSSIGWRYLQPMLARQGRVCAYDRAGLGFSDPGPLPRDASALADDLEGLVDAAALRPPFLLVGNSMGGQVVRLFAFRRPDQVYGLLLLDPYAEGQYAELAKVEASLADEVADFAVQDEKCLVRLRAGELSGPEAEREGCITGTPNDVPPALRQLMLEQQMQPSAYEAAISEAMAFNNANDDIVARETRSLGNTPLIILSAAGNFARPRLAEKRRALLDVQYRLHTRMAALSTRGEVRWASAGHVIQTGNPELVAAVVSEMIWPRDRAQKEGQ